MDLEAGIFNAGLFQAEIKRTLIEIAGESILMVDSSKFGRANGVLVAPLARFRTVITDTAAPEPEVAGLRALGVQVILVEPVSEAAALPSVMESEFWSLLRSTAMEELR